ncbi:hypothetical protein [Ferruginibacter sp. HRS2-29]|uniref:phosphoribosyltransferase-like protein n=1 Tax=Ferruginibacter sp. HRS2-29 TaxID=2487334 RepID=UPI0020CCE78E|nr:hypothetical protein [Ferruginibacter sp. HRS2-29]MCP9749494.1 hypothetical protein [Ferruginibacter sp. HRS2-29]
MRSILAEKLLIKVMNWSAEEVAQERPLIQAMANLKYDEYQQFSPGIRFTESLAQWLSQFDSKEREYAYSFIKENLIFITADQITHLVNICFAQKINPWLLRKVSLKTTIPFYLVTKLRNHISYKEILRKSLFLGVSDGAKIDLLRRSSGISNEQVFSSYFISSEKKDDLLSELEKDGFSGKFQSVYLIDDFTGSGLSYARTEDGVLTGKIIKFLRLIFNIQIAENKVSVLSELIDSSSFDLHIIFYIARRDSLNYLEKQIKEWQQINSLHFEFSVDAIQVIEDVFESEAKSNKDLLDISKKYITSEILDRHFKKGKHLHYYLGFDECALPLVLHHNTPNNSLPILWWYPENDQFRGIFPRVTRHRE